MAYGVLWAPIILLLQPFPKQWKSCLRYRTVLPLQLGISRGVRKNQNGEEVREVFSLPMASPRAQTKSTTSPWMDRRGADGGSMMGTGNKGA